MRNSKRNPKLEVTLAVIRTVSLILAMYWVAIFVATHLPSSNLPKLSSDKLYHLIAFSGLSFLLAWAVPIGKRAMIGHCFLVGVVVVLYGCFDEWSQQFSAGRQGDVYDLIADTCGCFVGLLFFALSRGVVLRSPALQRLIRFPMTSAELRS